MWGAEMLNSNAARRMGESASASPWCSGGTKRSRAHTRSARATFSLQCTMDTIRDDNQHPQRPWNTLPAGRHRHRQDGDSCPHAADVQGRCSRVAVADGKAGAAVAESHVPTCQGCCPMLPK